MSEVQRSNLESNLVSSKNEHQQQEEIQQQNEHDHDDQPELPLEFQAHMKKPLPTIQNEEGENNFFFTMVDVEGKKKQKQEMESEQEQVEESDQRSESRVEETPEESEQSIREINPLEEVKVLLERFNKYDHKLLGMIPLQNARTIFQEMEIDITNFNSVADISIMTKKQYCTFDQFLAMLNQFQERKFEINETKLFSRREFKIDPRLISFIRLLDQYRKKNEILGQYKQAKSAKIKIKQIKQKEAIRKESILRILHTQEITSLEQMQRKQFQEFNLQWDKYMEDYEKVAIESLQNIKYKHIKELQEYDQKIKDQIPKIYYSKNVLELRTKEKNLVKLQQYEEANKIRLKIDDLQEAEQNKHQMDVIVSLENKINNFRTKQTTSLNALLKKIQKDRNKQLKTRQADSQRVMVKNRNLRNELLYRHHDEIKRSIESLKELMVDEGHRNENKKRKSVQSTAFK